MQNTTNYNLKKFVDSDNADLPSLCENFDVIDDALTPTVDQATAPTSTQKGKVGVVIGWIANRIKAITGKTNWWEAPATNLETVNSHVLSTSIHAVASSSYMAFCTNANANSLDAAFGKNNESAIGAIGKQLAMYAWFKGKDKTANPYTELLTKNTLLEIATDITTWNLILADDVLLALVLASPYARTTMFNATRPIILYNTGNEMTSVTNGWTTSASVGGTATKTNNKLSIAGDINSVSGTIYTTLKPLLSSVFNRCKLNILSISSYSQISLNIFGYSYSGSALSNLAIGLKTISVSGYSNNGFSLSCTGNGSAFAVDYIALYCE